MHAISFLRLSFEFTVTKNNHVLQYPLLLQYTLLALLKRRLQAIHNFYSPTPVVPAPL